MIDVHDIDCNSEWHLYDTYIHHYNQYNDHYEYYDQIIHNIIPVENEC